MISYEWTDFAESYNLIIIFNVHIHIQFLRLYNTKLCYHFQFYETTCNILILQLNLVIKMIQWY